MIVNKTEYYVEVETEDFIFLVQTDGTQISIERNDGESMYIDLNKDELKSIFESIKEVYENLK